MYRSDQYLDYTEMTELLEEWEQEFSDILTLSSIGRTFEGREQYLVTLTEDHKTEGKSALLIDGGLHAKEIVGSMAALFVLHDFLMQSRTEEGKKILREKILYFIPRINADGMEKYLKTGEVLRGSVRMNSPEEDGIVSCDMDGDHIIVKMRIPSRDGKWKKCREDERLMIPREETDQEGEFYDLFDEGYLRGEKTEPLKEARSPYDADPNRQFPFAWKKDEIGITGRSSSGKYPLYDQEVRQLAAFVRAHNEIGFIVNFHSFTGAYITPMEFLMPFGCPKEDDELIAELAREAGEETGYVHKGFFPRDILPEGFYIPATYTGWSYMERGIVGICNEMWNPRLLTETIDRDHPIEKMDMFFDPETQTKQKLALLKWSDEHEGYGFAPWTEREIEGLGRVEIGGFKEKFLFDNPPEEYLPAECEKGLNFVKKCIQWAPQLRMKELEEKEGKLFFHIENPGRFPVYGTEQALEKGYTRPAQVRFTVINQEGTEICQETELFLKGGEEAILTYERPGNSICRLQITSERAGSIEYSFG